MNISNKYPVMIFKNQYGKYYAGLNKKIEERKYDSAYFQVVFNKNVSIENKTKIYIKNAWLDFYNWENEGRKGTTFYIRISDFEKVEEAIENSKSNSQIVKEAMEEKTPFEEFGEAFEDMELPF